jgi:hypothetical protein
MAANTTCGADWLVRTWLTPHHARRRRHPLPDVRDQLGVRRLADQQALGLARQQNRHQAQDQADDHRGHPVQSRIIEMVAGPHPHRRHDQADQGGAVLEQHHEVGRILGSLDGLPDAQLAATGVELLDRHRPRPPFQQDGDTQHDVVDRRVMQRLGLLDVVPALIDRHPRPQGKDQQGDDKGPEIEFAPIAEGIGRIRRAFGPVLAMQEQHLIAAVDQRVHPLGQHGRRAGDRGGDKLGDGNAEIGEQGGEQHQIGLDRMNLGSVLAHGKPSMDRSRSTVLQDRRSRKAFARFSPTPTDP